MPSAASLPAPVVPRGFERSDMMPLLKTHVFRPAF